MTPAAQRRPRTWGTRAALRVTAKPLAQTNAVRGSRRHGFRHFKPRHSQTVKNSFRDTSRITAYHALAFV